jgi:hypothetical protein
MFPRNYPFTPEQIMKPGPHKRAYMRILADEIYRPNRLMEILEERRHRGR